MMMRPALPQAGMLGVLASVHLLLFHSSCQFHSLSGHARSEPAQTVGGQHSCNGVPKQAKLNMLKFLL